jgi:hypothetical protein
MDLTPRDLDVIWTPDAMICETRPFARTTRIAGLTWVAPLVGFLLLFVSALLAVGLFVAWFGYVWVHALVEHRRAAVVQQIRLTSHRFVFVRSRNEVPVREVRIPLRSIGRVEASRIRGDFALRIRRAGEEDLWIEINNESEAAGTWLASTVQAAARLARESDGLATGEVPQALRALLEAARS